MIAATMYLGLIAVYSRRPAQRIGGVRLCSFSPSPLRASSKGLLPGASTAAACYPPGGYRRASSPSCPSLCVYVYVMRISQEELELLCLGLGHQETHIAVTQPHSPALRPTHPMLLQAYQTARLTVHVSPQYPYFRELRPASAPIPQSG